MAGYGILVNGNTYFAGTHQGTNFEGYDEYLAHVTVAAGDQLQLCDDESNAQWVVDLNPFSVTGFTKGASTYTASVSGCYDFYIQLMYNADRLYIGNGSNCGAGEPYQATPACVPQYGLLVDGQYVPGTHNAAQTEWTEYMILGLSLTAGQTVQIYDTCTQAAWVIPTFAETSYTFTVDNDHYVVSETGTYDFYIKFIYEADEIYVSKEGMYRGAVPSRCSDVLLQGFYYDSYEVDSGHPGTLTYGDTKWKTLLAQAGEIGAYFDLIWLPPSGLASGTGYHPRQYANQNSDWGSRTDLQNLISALHNSGTKVVADIVINHAEGLTTWCDMAVEDFGEYGRFEPDGSYITSNDEVNLNPDAEDCFGYSASSRADDGANWEGARDWAHDNPAVQEMFKAYLLWMKNVIGYDGWRYDKGDGYNNWHMDNYNNASEPYIAFEEYYDGNAENVKNAIRAANMNMMAFDFPAKFDAINPIAGWNYVGRRGLIGLDDTGSDYWKRHAITWVENHDMFMREDNELEFGGRGQSMTPVMKYRVLGANAFILSMPGIPCIFYPHWVQYKEELKQMINARHLAGVHNESEVRDEYWDNNNSGYQATIVGTNGYLILCLGTKTGQTFDGFTKVASGSNTYNDNGTMHNESYEMWVLATNPVAPGLIVTPSATFEDLEAGIKVGIQAVGGSGPAVIYYTTDGSDPTTASAVYTDSLTFTQTTTLRVMAACGTAQSAVQEYTYTYREPLQRGIRVRFLKPEEWEKVYLYSWIPGVDEQGNATSENIMGAYPGQRIYQDVDGWFAYEFDASLATVHFCINSGDDCGGVNVRSNDLEINYDACYGWRAGKELESSEEIILPCDTALNPDFDIVISPESGFFRNTTEGQQVTISVVGKHNASIYYTLDGSEPTTASPLNALETVTFDVHETTTVRAMAYSASDKQQTDVASATYTYKAPQTGAITVQYIKPAEWEDLYLYAFTRVKVGNKNRDTAYPLNGDNNNKKWPGMKWTTKNGEWYTFTFPDDVSEIYVIFTEGNQKPQTQDIYLAENACYVWNADCRKAVISPNCDGQTDDPIEGIEDILTNALPDFTQPMYNVLGQPVRADYRGIVLQNGHKYLLR